MYKKTIITASIMLVAGTACLSWVFHQQAKHRQLLDDHNAIIAENAEIIVDQAGIDDEHILALNAATVDAEHQQAMRQYQANAEIRELALTIAILLMLPASLTLILLSAAKIFTLLKKAAVTMARELAAFLRISQKKQNHHDQSDQNLDSQPQPEQDTPFVEQAIKDARLAKNTAAEDTQNPDQAEQSEQNTQTQTKQDHNTQHHLETVLSANAVNQAQKAEHLLGCDDNPKRQLRRIARADSASPPQAKNLKITRKNPGVEQTSKLLQDQTKTIQQQLAEFKQIADDARESAKSTTPLTNTISDLAQQVAAIRQYAATQQERVTRLQDGYDWNIIRNFGLRIIRCVDNLQNKIDNATDTDYHHCLEEVKDELVFALESTGIEQFEPQIDSDYKGQEKHAEAVKDKKYTDQQSLKGKIAQVIRPGYQYFIDQENLKIVRTAQVKLYA